METKKIFTPQRIVEQLSVDVGISQVYTHECHVCNERCRSEVYRKNKQIEKDMKIQYMCKVNYVCTFA